MNSDRADAQSCKDDSCICTDAALTSASSCSSCVGGALHGANYTQQMASYAAFSGNCSSEVSGLVSLDAPTTLMSSHHLEAARQGGSTWSRG